MGRAARGGPWTASIGTFLALALLLGGAALAVGTGAAPQGAHRGNLARSLHGAPSVAPRPQSVGSVMATIPVGWDPEALAFDATDNKMFVANQAGGGTASNPGNLSVIDPTSNRVSAWVPLPSDPGYGAPGPDALAYDGANGDLYVVDANNFHVSVLSASTYANLSWIDFTSTAGNSGSLALDTSSGTLFMVSYDNQRIYTIDTASNTDSGNFFTEPANSILAQLPQQVCFDAANGDLYVAQENASGTDIPSDIVVDTASSHAFIKNFTTTSNSGDCVVDSTNGYVYVAGGTANDIAVINGATNALVTTISDPSNGDPWGIAFDPSNGYVYVADETSNTVTVIDGSSDTVLGSIAVASQPRAIAYDSTNGDLYVASILSGNSAGTISVISPSGGGGGGGPTITSFTANPSSISLGQSTVFTASVSGGTSPYSFSYSGLPTGCSSQNLAALPCTPSTPGTYTALVTVTDSAGRSATSNPGATLQVSAPAGYPTITSFSASPAKVSAGSTTTFSVQVSGGTTPYSYAYSSLPPGCSTQNTASLSCTPTTSGNYSVMVTVTDGSSHSVSSTTPLQVTGGTTPNGSGGGNGLLLPIIIGVVVVAAGAGLALYLLKFRKPKVPAPSMTPAPTPPPAYAPAPQ
ncbi:MAG: beta-propeller fold lactonase family protein, partial [Euryarchaeota archaeon]|nr:beta-propeller fold lactonase family protein [Euryarchaeota archaeon]MDE2046457.1 beta-propeller fold lactonase family protein [Thermoplasmata archaeon]